MENQTRFVESHILGTLSAPVRMLFTCFLLTIGAGYLIALSYLFVMDIEPYQKVGMTVVEGIEAKYHGQRGKTRLEAALRGPMSDKLTPADSEKIIQWIHNGATPEGFTLVQPIFEKICIACHSEKSGLPIPPLTTFDQVKEVAQVDTGTSLGELARVSHIHMFGISIIFLLTGGIFALSEISTKWRMLIIVLPYFAIWADIGAWWITKYEPIFAYVVLFGGGLMGVALAAQILISLWEMWFAKRATSTI
jgi:hypothetical protein